MKKLDAPSVTVGAALGALGLLSLLSLCSWGSWSSGGAGAAPRSVPATQAAGQEERWEYQILVDVSEKELGKLVEDHWEYAGYLGNSPRGSSADETLWKRPLR